MFCTYCGNSIRENDNFCCSCGKETPVGAQRRAQPHGYYAPRRLTRLVHDKSVAGVCAGFARYLDVDVTLVRLAMVTGVILSGGLGIIAYLAAWLIMPKDLGAPAAMGTAGAERHA